MNFYPIFADSAERRHWVSRALRFAAALFILAGVALGVLFVGPFFVLPVQARFRLKPDDVLIVSGVLGGLCGLLGGFVASLAPFGFALIIDDVHAVRIHSRAYMTDALVPIEQAAPAAAPGSPDPAPSTPEPATVSPEPVGAMPSSPAPSSPAPSSPAPSSPAAALNICPRCGSTHVTAQIVTDTQLVAAHHSIIWWICGGWLWVIIKWIFLFFPALIVKIFAPKRSKLKQQHRGMFVCQNCGHTWAA